MSRPPLDWTDEREVRRWAQLMRVAFDDIDAVTTDLLRPLRERDLGYVQHRKLYDAARSMALELIENAVPPGEDPRR